MSESTDDSSAAEPVGVAFPVRQEGGEREPWVWLYYEALDDAVAAAKGADLLGLSWRLLSQRPEDNEIETRQWVFELLLITTHPEAASSSICRDVE